MEVLRQCGSMDLNSELAVAGKWAREKAEI
jgi:hypothetical protein